MSSKGNSVPEITRSLGAEDAARVRRVLEGGIKIPPQPRVLDEMRRMMNRQEYDVRRLSRTIQQDPGLSAMLFKVVGNAAYRQHQPFETIEQILHAVGVKQTFNLVQAIALIDAGTPTADKRIYEAFWSRSQAVGQLAMLVAEERVAVCNIFADQAYLAGIFHACGVPLLLQRFASYGMELRLATPGHWVDWREEDRKFNTDHAVVGYLVARHWCLPGFICDAIRYQHSLADLGDHDARSMVAILALAIDIHARDQRIPNPEWDEVRNVLLPELGLDEESLPEFIDVVLERFNHATHV